MAFSDERQEWYEPEAKVAVTLVDVAGPARALVRGHLAGPASAHFLARGLAAAALLGAETEDADETVILQMKCSGPLGGLVAECTAAGTLRGYAEKKVLDDFDGLGTPDARKVVGDMQIQVTRSVPGRILSQGISGSLDGYLAGSLQRRAVIRTSAVVGDDAEVALARGVMVEVLPDSPLGTDPLRPLLDPKHPVALDVAPRTILARLGLPKAELRRTTPLRFACRCSPERAVAMLSALGEDERKGLPPTVDITCHMCGRTWTVRTGA